MTKSRKSDRKFRMREWLLGILGLRNLRTEEAQDLAEYGMLSALIAVVVIAALILVGGSLATLWTNITTAFAALP